MKLVNYEVSELPEKPVRHNFGDKLGMVTISEELKDTYTDEHAEFACEHGFYYFKKKEL